MGSLGLFLGTPLSLLGDRLYLEVGGDYSSLLFSSPPPFSRRYHGAIVEKGSDPGYLHSGAFEESADQGAEEGFLALLPEQGVSHHNARKEEDDGGDEKTRSPFAEERKGADLSPGVVGTGARHRGAAGQRRDRRGEGGETGAERLLGDVSSTSEYHGPNSGYLSTGDSPERRSAEGDRGNARGDVEGCAAGESSTVDYVRCARCEGMKVFAGSIDGASGGAEDNDIGIFERRFFVSGIASGEFELDDIGISEGRFFARLALRERFAT
eukprot:jgi/Undpi1/4377/HiC_scaffold_17.g07736.m1